MLDDVILALQWGLYRGCVFVITFKSLSYDVLFQ
jgi:hypothetical protein